MKVVNGTADVITYFVLRDSTNHAPKTDVTITDIDLYYVIEKAAISAKVDATALSAATDNHTDNYAFNIGQGVYRIDWPDTCFDGGVGTKCILIVVCSGVDTTFLEVELIGTHQTGDSYAVVAHTDYGNAKLVRSTTPANTLTVDASHLVAVPATQKVDVETVKTQAVTCAAGVTVLASVGAPAAPGASGGLPTTNGTKLNQTVDLTAGQSIACSDKTGFSLASTGADLILKSSTFIQAIVAAINEFATYGLTAINTLLVTTGIKTASIAANAITATAIAADAITEAKIADNALANEHFAAGALTSAEITSAAGCVVASIGNGAITADAIATNAIDDDAIAADVTAVIAGAVWNAATASYGGAGTYGQAVEDALADTNEMQGDLVNGGRLDLLIDGIKAKTDSLTFTVGNQVDANIQYINDTAVAGNGGVTPWGPA